MHRDLKPANIFLTLDGTVKVGDLGLSRELSENTYQAHSKVGTPLYMSPEVLRGDGYDFKSDIWSIGCLLYELAMLKSPFKSEGLNLYSLFQKISQGEYSPLPDRYSEARAMRVQCHEEYIKRKQQEQQERDGEEESSSVRGRAQETKDGRGMDDSPRSTVSKTTINSTTSRSPAEDGPSPSVGRGSVASRKREVDSEGSGDEDKGSRVGSRGGGRGSRTNSGRRRNDADDEDSTNTEDTRSNVRVA
ncbi:Nek7, partial [Symbiodinium microadriaticum]